MQVRSEISRRWGRMTLPVKLIVINVVVFALLRLTGIVMLIAGGNINVVVDMLAVPSDFTTLLHRPWTLLTYMFTHYDVLHILFNMLTLYWFGQLFMYRCYDNRLVWLYLIGGLAGALTYIGAAQLLPTLAGTLLGASAAVMAIVIATAVIMPDFEIGMLFIGRVKLKWVAIGAIALFALGLVGNNAGGHVAHFGGIIAGALYALAWRRGIDVGGRLNRFFDSLMRPLRRIKLRPARPAKPKFNKRNEANSRCSTADNTTSDADDRRQLDIILDKIKKSGYSSLTDEERRRLFDVSKRVK